MAIALGQIILALVIVVAEREVRLSHIFLVV